MFSCCIRICHTVSSRNICNESLLRECDDTILHFSVTTLSIAYTHDFIHIRSKVNVTILV